MLVSEMVVGREVLASAEVAPKAAREETHIEAQLRYKLEEKEEEIAALKLKLKSRRATSVSYYLYPCIS